MAEQSIAPETESVSSQDLSHQDWARMRRIGAWHGTAVLAALTLWGTADLWAQQSGWALALLVSLGMAVAVGRAIGAIGHEWGHFAGARLAGARSPVRNKPVRLYFMFEFDMAANSPRQFISMSLGGISANWLLFLAALVLIPLATPAAVALACMLFAQAVNVSLFEVPIVRSVMAGADPDEALQLRLKEYGVKSLPGWAAGLALFVVLV